MNPIPPTLAEGEKEHVVIYQDEAGYHDNDFEGVMYWL